MRRAAALRLPRPGELQSPSVQRISWSAIFAGVVVAVAVQLLLSMLGVGIGLGLVEPMAGDTPGAGSFGIGAGLWWLVSNLLALVAGGYVAAWLAGNTLRFDGMLHGVVTWGITLLLTFYLLGSAIGGIIGGAFGMIGGAASGAASVAGEGLKAAAPQVGLANVTPDQILDQAKAYLQPANPDPASLTAEAAQKEIATAMPKLLAGGDQAKQARERIVGDHGSTAEDQPRGRRQALRRGPGAADPGQGPGDADGQGRGRPDRERGVQGIVAGVHRPGARRGGRSLRRLARGPAACRLRPADRSWPDRLLIRARSIYASYRNEPLGGVVTNMPPSLVSCGSMTGSYFPLSRLSRNCVPRWGTG